MFKKGISFRNDIPTVKYLRTTLFSVAQNITIVNPYKRYHAFNVIKKISNRELTGVHVNPVSAMAARQSKSSVYL